MCTNGNGEGEVVVWNAKCGCFATKGTEFSGSFRIGCEIPRKIKLKVELLRIIRIIWRVIGLAINYNLLNTLITQRF